MACARVPLDEQQVTEPGSLGKQHTLPALVSHKYSCSRNNPTLQILTIKPVLHIPHQHPVRKDERCFVPYKPPPEDGSPAEVEEFLEHAKFITEDLEWLLALPHDKFWCQVTCEPHFPFCSLNHRWKHVNKCKYVVDSVTAAKGGV